jgi:hypothetical protein
MFGDNMHKFTIEIVTEDNVSREEVMEELKLVLAGKLRSRYDESDVVIYDDDPDNTDEGDSEVE